MDLNKLTMKSQAALQEASQQAATRHHQLIEPEHVLFALLADGEGVVFPLLHHVGASPAQLRAKVDEALDAMPKVYAQGVDVRISPATARLL
ncbi:MAG: Clp protease N-terminal domain-containing protein, partial [Actinomycetota bacterium]